MVIHEFGSVFKTKRRTVEYKNVLPLIKDNVG